MDSKVIQQRQQEIVEEFGTIGFMKKGSIVYQQMAAKQGAGEGAAVHGPYPLLTWKEKGRTKSLRLKTPEEVAWAETAIANYRRFNALRQEYEELGEQAALAQRAVPAGASPEAQKKGLKRQKKPKRK